MIIHIICTPRLPYMRERWSKIKGWRDTEMEEERRVEEER